MLIFVSMKTLNYVAVGSEVHTCNVIEENSFIPIKGVKLYFDTWPVLTLYKIL